MVDHHCMSDVIRRTVFCYTVLLLPPHPRLLEFSNRGLPAHPRVSGFWVFLVCIPELQSPCTQQVHPTASRSSIHQSLIVSGPAYTEKNSMQRLEEGCPWTGFNARAASVSVEQTDWVASTLELSAALGALF